MLNISPFLKNIHEIENPNLLHLCAKDKRLFFTTTETTINTVHKDVVIQYSQRVICPHCGAPLYRHGSYKKKIKVKNINYDTTITKNKSEDKKNKEQESYQTITIYVLRLRCSKHHNHKPNEQKSFIVLPTNVVHYNRVLLSDNFTYQSQPKELDRYQDLENYQLDDYNNINTQNTSVYLPKNIIDNILAIEKTKIVLESHSIRRKEIKILLKSTSYPTNPIIPENQKYIKNKDST